MCVVLVSVIAAWLNTSHANEGCVYQSCHQGDLSGKTSVLCNTPVPVISDM